MAAASTCETRTRGFETVSTVTLPPNHADCIVAALVACTALAAERADVPSAKMRVQSTTTEPALTFRPTPTHAGKRARNRASKTAASKADTEPLKVKTTPTVGR